MPSVVLRLIEGGLSRAAVAVTDGVPGNAEFSGMIKARRRELHTITKMFANGEITLAAWHDRCMAILLEGHTRANYFGRMLAAQVELDPENADIFAAVAATDSEEYYLRGFSEALQDLDSRYWDAEAQAWLTDAIEARQDLYLGKMRGTANAAFLRESLDDQLFYWMLGGTEDHCQECPDYAAGSPWRADELPTHPGDNSTPCRFNCLCFLRREDDVYGFRKLDF